MVIQNKPHQCTLVPDSPDVLTSDQGWDTIGQESFLKDIIMQLKKDNILLGIDGGQWIVTKRQKTNTRFEVSLNNNDISKWIQFDNNSTDTNPKTWFQKLKMLRRLIKAFQQLNIWPLPLWI